MVWQKHKLLKQKCNLKWGWCKSQNTLWCDVTIPNSKLKKRKNKLFIQHQQIHPSYMKNGVKYAWVISKYRFLYQKHDKQYSANIQTSCTLSKGLGLSIQPAEVSPVKSSELSTAADACHPAPLFLTCFFLKSQHSSDCSRSHSPLNKKWCHVFKPALTWLIHVTF